MRGTLKTFPQNLEGEEKREKGGETEHKPGVVSCENEKKNIDTITDIENTCEKLILSHPRPPPLKQKSRMLVATPLE